MEMDLEESGASEPTLSREADAGGDSDGGVPATVTATTVTDTSPVTERGVRKIKVGDHIILCLNEDKYIFAEVSQDGVVNVNKRRYPLKTLIGAPFRSVWEAPRNGKTLLPLKEKPQIQDIGDINPTDDADVTADNRDLVDNNKNQKLTQQEIVAMQDTGASGTSIIKALVQNSASYQSKTEFSKAKYLKKKAKKHILVVEVLEPSLDNITVASFARKPSSVCHMRVDSLARLLTFSDARAGANVLVIESCKGIVTGALAERVGGHGKVVTLHIQGRSNLSAIDLFNFSDDVRKSILHAPLTSLREIYHTLLGRPLPPTTSVTVERGGSGSRGGGRPFFAPMEELNQVFAQGFDSLVIAVKALPSPFLYGLLPFLKPSSPFIVFSPFMQQLADCYVELQRVDEAINLQLSETWMRQYQVLPSRTRPPMNMNGASGFLLTGNKIYNERPLPTPAVDTAAAGLLKAAGEEIVLDAPTSSASASSSSPSSSSPRKKKARIEGQEEDEKEGS